LWLRPPLWTFEQYRPRSIDLSRLKTPAAMPPNPPRFAIVTPSLNQGEFLRATIDSVLAQDYPHLHYHVQDCASTDGTLALLQSYGNRISLKSIHDRGQSHAINLGFAGVECDIMAYLNGDDVLLPGTLATVAAYFHAHPEVDFVYGNRVFIDREGLEIGRAVLPRHHAKTLCYADYVPQETMFWRRRVWDKIGAFDETFHYALDWDFILRAQAAGFKFTRLSRFIACFRVHDDQKTATNYDVGRREMAILRLRYLGRVPSQRELYSAILPYLMRQLAYHWLFRLGLLRG
jgi:GT2 family glycosyltransferase